MSFEVFLSNWQSPALHGSGDRFGIMLRPRSFELEASAGRVPVLIPRAEDLDAAFAGRIDAEEYRRRFELSVPRIALGPGELVYVGTDGKLGTVLDGDSLLCACGVEKALAGRCHRTYAAGLLAAAGWVVVADGFRLEPCGCEQAARATCATCRGRGFLGSHPYLNPAQRSLL